MDPLLAKNLITTKDASEVSGYTSDYLARLVRGGEIAGKKIGHSWLIDSSSLDVFLSKQKNHKLNRSRELANSRVKEYRTHNEPLHRIANDLTTKFNVVSKIESLAPEIDLVRVSLRSHLLAFSVALAVIVSGATLASAQVVSQFAGRVADVATEVAHSLTETYGDVPSHIASHVNEVALKVSNSGARVAATNAEVSENLASPILMNPDLSSLQMIVGETSSMHVASNFGIHERSIANASSSAPQVHIITRAEIEGFVFDTFSLVTSPSKIASSIVNSYNAVGANGYALINASFASYRSLLDVAGEKVLAIAATTRDAVASAPLALGNAVIEATHSAIRAEVGLAYVPAAVAPETARVSVAFMGSVGGALAKATSQTPSFIANALLRATEAPAHLAPAIAEAVFNAEYTGASQFLAVTDSAKENYLALVQKTGAIAYTSTVKAQSGIDSLAKAPALIEDAYLGALGKTALALDTLAHTSPVAAALVATAPAFSVGEKVAITTYREIHSLFDGMTSALAVLFTPAPITPVAPIAPQAPVKKFAVLTPARSNSYSSYTTVVQGVSQDALNQALEIERSRILGTVAGMIQPVAAQGVTNMTTIQQVNMIQDLTDLIVRNGDFRGGRFTGGSIIGAVAISATSGTFTTLTSTNATFGTLTAGPSSLATTTITGTLAVTGALSSDTSVTTPFFVASSTNATSTFAGSVNIDNGGLVYATSTRNIGMGVLSPAALLAIQNSTSTQPIFVASNAAGVEVYRITDGGFVGIGSTTPGYALAVEGSSSLGTQAIAGYFTATTTTATSTFAGSLAIGTTTPFGNGLLTVGTSSPMLHIDNNSGNIGINALASNYRLDVNGTVRSVGDAFFNSNVSLGDATSTDVTYFNSRIAGHLVPTVDNVSDLGDGANWLRWRTGYFGTSVGIGGTATSTGVSLLASGAYLVDSASPLSINTTNNQNVLFGTGNVGIGTTSPFAKFSVAGNGYFDGTLTASSITATSSISAPYFTATDATATSTFAGGFTVGTTKFVVNNFNGNVGIGTTAPRGTLDVNGSIVTTNSANFNYSGSNVGNTQIDNQGTGGGARIFANTGGGSTTLFLNTNGNSYLNGGNVGIGTTSPLSKLSIQGSDTTSSNSSLNITDSTGASKLFVRNDGLVAIGTTVPSAAGRFFIQQSGNTASDGMTMFPGTGSASFRIYNNGSGGTLNVAGTDIISMTTANISLLKSITGNVGIGYDPATISGGVMAINGNLGIGTTSPSTKLEIITASANDGIKLTRSDGERSVWLTDGSAGRGDLYLFDGANSNSVYITGNGSSFLNGGNVGIGTTSPVSKLSVVGESAFAGGGVFGLGYAGTVAPVNGLLIQGNVGIGTITPVTFKVEVAGSVGPSADLAYDLGTSGRRWNNVYAGTVTATNLSGNVIPTGFTQGPVVFGAVGGALAQDNAFFWDNTNKRLGVGTTSPQAQLAVQGTGEQFRIGYDSGNYSSISTTNTGRTNFFNTGNNFQFGATSPALKLLSADFATQYAAFNHDGSNGSLSNYIGGFTINNIANGALSFRTNNVNKLVLGADTNGDINLYNGTGKVIINGTGNVGIGTTTPGQSLTVTGTMQLDSTGTPNFRITKSGTVQTYLGVSSGGDLLSAAAANDTVIRAQQNLLLAAGGDTTRIYISGTTGNIGIGTTSPQSNLNVSVSATSVADSSVFSLTNSDAYNAGTQFEMGLGWKQQITASANPVDIANIYVKRQSAVSGTNSASMNFVTSGSSRIYVKEDGNVGIGMTSPGIASSAGRTYLTIKGSTIGGVVQVTSAAADSDGSTLGLIEGVDSVNAFRAGYIQYILSGTTANNRGGAIAFGTKADGGVSAERMRIDNAGNVGIGTTNPLVPLDVQGFQSYLGTNASARFAKSIVLANIQGVNSVNAAGDGQYTLIRGDASNDTVVGAGGAGATIFGAGGTTEFMRVATSGNVGIGTTSPFAKLSVAGNGYFDGTLTASSITATSSISAPYFVATSATATSTFAGGVAIGTTDLVIDSTTGYVGVGTASPIAPLHVVGSTIQTGTLSFRTSAPTPTWRTAEIAGIDEGSNFKGALAFYTHQVNGGGSAPTEKMRIDSSGNVGIGTTTPGSLLEVAGGTTINGTSNGSSSYLQFKNASTNVGIIGSDRAIFGNSSTDFGIYAYGANKLYLATNNVQRLTVDSTGNVGIGTTNPSSLLSISSTNPILTIQNSTDGSHVPATYGNLSFRTIDGSGIGPHEIASVSAVNTYTGAEPTGDLVFSTAGYDAAATEKMRITSGGNVGIGTTTPDQLLQLSSVTYPKIHFTDTTHSTDGWVGSFYTGVPGNFGMMSTNTAGYLAFGTNSTIKMVVDNTGNVGIGTTSPSQILSVQGNGLFSGNIYAANIIATGTMTTGSLIPAGPYTNNLASYDIGATGSRWNAVWAGTYNVGTSTFSLKSDANSNLGIFTAASGAGTQAMTVTQAGSVGIGTSNPEKLLSLSSSSGTSEILRLVVGAGSGSVQGSAYIGFNNWAGQTNPGAMIGAQESNTGTYQSDLVFFTRATDSDVAATERMRILTNGNVGIGTTAPGEKLQVNGAVRLSAASAGFAASTLQFDYQGGRGRMLTYGPDASNRSPMYFSQAYSDNTGSIDSMMIDKNGNVGIGTTNPGKLLSVNGSAVVGGANFLGSYGIAPQMEIQQASFVVSGANDTGTLSIVGSGTATQDYGAGIVFSAPYSGSSQASGGFLRVAKENATGGDYSYYMNFGTRLSGGNVTERMRITSTGNVGIGTTTPGAKLSVVNIAAGASGAIYPNNAIAQFEFGNSNGVVSLAGTSANELAYVFSTANGAYDGMMGYQNRNMYFKTASAERMRIDSTGNVGIGTTTPQYKFHVYGVNPITVTQNTSSTGYGSNRIFNDQNSIFRALEMDYSGSAYSGSLITGGPAGESASLATTGAYPLVLGTNNTARITIGSTGYVGIGTSSPQFALSLPTPAAQIGWQFGADSSSRNWVLSGDGMVYGDFGIWTSSSRTNGLVDISRFYISPSGNIGIGNNTSPVSKLDTRGIITSSNSAVTYASFDGNTGSDLVITANAGAANVTSNLIFKSSGASGTAVSEKMRISSTGNVGIGTTSPSQLLEVAKVNANDAAIKVSAQGTGAGAYFIADSAVDQFYGIRFNSNGTAKWAIGDFGRGSLGFNRGDISTTPKMVLDVNGNVGIGSTTPWGRLSADTSSLAAGVPSFVVGSSTRTDLIVTQAGYVGIGNANPSFALDVTGSAQVSGTVFTPQLRVASIYDYNSTANAAILFGSTSKYIALSTNAIERIRIDSAGNVGIGTTTPYGKLSITSGSPGAGAKAYPNYDDLIIENSADAGITVLNPDASMGNINFGSPSQQFIAGLRAEYNGGTERLSFRVADSDKLVILDSGNVGIGTTSPSKKLEVAGDILISPTASALYLTRNTNGVALKALAYTSASDCSTSGGDDMCIGASNNMYFRAWSNGSTNMTILNGGNVGIGTTTPSAKLSVYQGASGAGVNVNANGFVLENSGNVGMSFLAPAANYAQIFFGDLNNNSRGQIAYGLSATAATGDRDAMQFVTNGSEKMRILSNGNVGIGTTSPSTALHVSKNLVHSQLTLDGGSIGYGGGINFVDAGATHYNWFVGNQNNVSDAFEITPSTAIGGTTFNSPKLVVLAGGNVGIGTTGPGSLLTIQSATPAIEVRDTSSGGNEGGSLDFMTYENAANVPGARIKYKSIGAGYGEMQFFTSPSNGGAVQRMVIDKDGNVGIGTTAPVMKFEVTGNSNDSTAPKISLYDTAGFSNARRFTWTNAFDATSNYLNLSLNNDAGAVTGNLLTVRSGGNIGVGTTTPWGQLSVNPNGVTGPAFVVGSSTKTDLIVTNAGKVGVGTANPSQLLSVFNNGLNGADWAGISLQSQTGQTWNVNAGISGVANNVFAISRTANGTNPAFMINTSDYVGIGTTNPTTALQVGSIAGDIFNVDTATPNYVKLSADRGLRLVANSNYPMGFFNGSSQSMILDGAGNFGIGTSTPYSRLSVWGANTIAGVNMFELTNSASTTLMSMDNAGNLNVGVATATTTLAGGLNVNSGGLLYDLSSGVTSVANLNLGATTFDTDAGVVQWLDMLVTSGSVAGTVESYTANLNSNPMLTVYGLADGIGGMTNLGVGIGTTTPAAMLSVNSLVQQSGNLPLFNISSTTGSTLFTVLGNGNVGIGTTAPGAKLEVNRVTQAAASATGLTTVANSAFTLSAQTDTNNRLAFGIGDGSYAWIQSQNVSTNAGLSISLNPIGGNVGIGTTSPGTALHIYGGANSGTIPLFIDGSLANDNSFINFRVQNVSKSFIGYNSSANAFQVLNAAGSGNALLNIQNGGNVGIGTTNPGSYKLDVNGSVVFGSDANSRVYLGTTSSIPYIQGFGSNNQLAFYTSSEVMRINGGNVGIGTTGPGKKLHVYGPASGGGYMMLETNGAFAGTDFAAIGFRQYADTGDPAVEIKAIGVAAGGGYGADLVFGLRTNGTSGAGGALLVEKMRVTNTGNVGIGTTNPSTPLDVAGAITTSNQLVLSGGSLRVVNGYGQVALNFSTAGANSDLYFTTHSTERMRILDNGNVGIGTTTPSGKLEIWKTSGSASDLFHVSSTTAGDMLTINSSGNVGIGTTAPGMKLDVNGVVRSLAGNGFETLRSSNDWGWRVYANASNYLTFSTGAVGATTGTTWMTILDGSGNVGIGTVLPRSKLDVTTGLANIAGDTSDTANFTGANQTVNNGNLSVNTNDAQATGVGGSIALGGLYRAAARDNATFATIKAGKTNSTDSNYSGYLAFGTRNSGSSVSERMRIDNTGNVGIGTTGPTTKLQVDGQGGTGSVISVTRDYNNAVQASRGGIMEFRPAYDSNGQGNIITTNYWGDVNQGTLTLNAYNQSNQLVVHRSGNVGIGTTGPTAVLHLKAGTATASTAPIKLTSGVVNTTPEAGAIEFDGTDLFITI